MPRCACWGVDGHEGNVMRKTRAAEAYIIPKRLTTNLVFVIIMREYNAYPVKIIDGRAGGEVNNKSR